MKGQTMKQRIKNTLNLMFGRMTDLEKELEKNTQFIQSARRLDIKDGDLIVLKHPGRLSASTVIRLTNSIEEIFKNWGHKNFHFILLEEGMDIGVFRKKADK